MNLEIVSNQYKRLVADKEAVQRQTRDKLQVLLSLGSDHQSTRPLRQSIRANRLELKSLNQLRSFRFLDTR